MNPRTSLHAADTALASVTQLVHAAGELAVALRSKAGNWTEKTPGQILTQSDLKVETMMRDGLARAFPDQPIVGEEFGRDAAISSAPDTFWTIDPIDGTANYVNGQPLWGIALGRVRNAKPDLGVIALPDLGVTLAGSDAGLFKNGDLIQSQPPRVGAVSLNLRSIGPQPEDLDLLRACHALGAGICHWRCSAASLAFVAEGKLSAHLDPHTTLWDAVPGAALCRAAGIEIRWGCAAGRLWIKAGADDMLAAMADAWPDPEGSGTWI